MTVYDLLAEMKAKVSVIPNIKTLKIGMEKGIGSKDTTFIRIVPNINEKGYTKTNTNRGCAASGGISGNGMTDDLTVDVIYGFNLKGITDLEALYKEFYDLERDIRSALNSKYSAGRCEFVRTVTDQDQLQNIKSAISTFKIVGIR